MPFHLTEEHWNLAWFQCKLFPSLLPRCFLSTVSSHRGSSRLESRTRSGSWSPQCHAMHRMHTEPCASQPECTAHSCSCSSRRTIYIDWYITAIYRLRCHASKSINMEYSNTQNLSSGIYLVRTDKWCIIDFSKLDRIKLGFNCIFC